MKQKPDSSPDRASTLRAALVDTVESTPARRGRIRPRFAIAAIAAFALAGAGTGGAIGAFAADKPAGEPDHTVTVNLESFALSIAGSHAQLFGTPFIVSGEGSLVVELGERPEGATSLLIASSCGSKGHVEYAIDGSFDSGFVCTDSTGSGGGGFSQVTGNGSHKIELKGTARYLIWAAWAADKPAPKPSAAQQVELADGIVTHDEYLAAFARFSKCMSDAGYPVIGGSDLGYMIDYSTTNDAYAAGVDQQCYIAEYQDVDAAWQGAHEDG